MTWFDYGSLHADGLLLSVTSADHGASSHAHSCSHSRALHPPALGRASAAMPEPFSIQGARSEVLLHALFSTRGAPQRPSLLSALAARIMTWCRELREALEIELIVQ